MQLKKTGLGLIALALGVPLIWFAPLAAKYDVIALFSQYLGMWALIAMAITQMIATRVRLIEVLFGGLDRTYILHKWLGIGAMSAILLHDTIDAEMRELRRQTILSQAAETAGEISLYALLILVVITIATFIPYHLWRWTHKAMGTFFALATFHYIFVIKPFTNDAPLALYVSGFCALGIISYIYTLAPRRMRAARPYKVTGVAKTGRGHAISMVPTRKPLIYQPGQFAFFTFAGNPEPHPFTISKAPSEGGALRITVAPSGDFTHTLGRQMTDGEEIQVEGPFGRFLRPSGDAPQIWIAGGIGITPFLAWADSMRENDAPVTLIYCARDRADASHLDALQVRADQLPNLTLVVHESSTQGRLTMETLDSYISGELGQNRVYFCGPKSLRKMLSDGLAWRGVSPQNFHYEEFEIRTGMGLRALAKYVLDRLEGKSGLTAR